MAGLRNDPSNPISPPHSLGNFVVHSTSACSSLFVGMGNPSIGEKILKLF